MTKDRHDDRDRRPLGTPLTLASTPAQLEMWFAEQAGHGAGCAYNESFTIELDGELDEDALVRAFEALAEWHEALRAHFSPDGAVFVIEPAIKVDVARYDLSTWSHDDAKAELARITQSDARTPYDLRNGPLFRGRIIRLSPRSRVVLLGAHHAVCDGWSLDVLLADLARLYGGYSGRTPMPSPPRHGFSDYVQSRQTEEHRAAMAKARSFWSKRFESLPPPLALPNDGQRPPVRSYGARHALHEVSPEIHALGKSFARGQGVSFFSVLLSAFAGLVHRISGATDFVVGIPVAGHPAAGMEDCVGHLVQLAPVRLEVQGAWSFLDLCRRVNTAILDARENASVGFGEIVAGLRVPRDPSRVPLVPIVFTHVQRYAPGELVFGDCEVRYGTSPRSFDAFEINLNIAESRVGLRLGVHVNADLYSQPWINWRLQEFEVVLQDGCAKPNTPVAALALLPAAESELLEAKFNGSAVAYPHTSTISQLLEGQAARTPSRIAIRQHEVAVTYRQLDERANRLAHVLRRRGVGRGTLVGLCLRRSPDMVAAVLGVLKAGGTYVPLDPAFPAERLAYMIESSKVALVVSEADLAAVHGCPAERTFEVDAAAAELDAASALPLPFDERSARPEDLAYVLYTSGSTGKPKGVCIGQRAVVNLLCSMEREPGFRSEDRLLAVTTLSFDIAVVELLLPLMVGAELVLATRDQAMDGRVLRRLLEENHVTVMQATPATWRMLLESGWQGTPTLKAFCCGEPMAMDLAEALLSRVGQLWNLYGPTETTVYSTGYRVEKAERGIPIGRPLANTCIWILDANRQPCPIGVIGEIYIGGDGVAHGYLYREDLSRERFIENPWGSRAGDRLYKTGDLGRWRADGVIECLGRNDFQVKIRGFRVELGEIEALLVAQPELAQAVVQVKPTLLDPSRLVAYVVRKDRGKEAPAGLADRLRKPLPAYMIPSVFVVLESLPLTPNGKIDRGALPDPGHTSAAPDCRPPSTPTERRLLEIWREVLKIENVGTNMSFFDVGGHSLLAMSVASLIRQRLGVEYPIAQLLRGPTIEAIAKTIDEARGEDGAAPVSSSHHLVLLRRGGDKRIFFSYSGTGDLAEYLKLALRLPPEFTVYGIAPARLPNIPQADLSVPDMAAHLVEVIRETQPEGPYYLGGMCAGGVTSFEAARQLEAGGDTVGLLILLEAINPTTRLRRWLTAKSRLQRLAGVFRPGATCASAGGNGEPAAPTDVRAPAARVLGTAWAKVRNAALYEAKEHIKDLSIGPRLRLLHYVLEHDREWPEWLPGLSEMEIYMKTRGSYRPGLLKCDVALVRATEGGWDDDTPASSFVYDPLLGWGKSTTGRLTVIDAHGSHVGMLVEAACVDELGRRLSELLSQSIVGEGGATAADARPASSALAEQ